MKIELWTGLAGIAFFICFLLSGRGYFFTSAMICFVGSWILGELKEMKFSSLNTKTRIYR